MKIKISIYFAAFAFAGLFLLTGCGPNPTVSASVDFGNPPKGGGPCGGKGFCSAVAQPQATALAGAGVAVTFQVSSTDKNVLNVSFSMADLKRKQPQQATFFSTTSNSYTFDGSYDLTDTMYAPLKLAPGAHIDSSCKSAVTTKGDIVTIGFTYAHN